AIDADPASADADLSARLGVNTPGEPDEGDAGRDVVEGKVRAAWEPGEPGVEASLERATASFKDVGGMDSLKDEIRMKVIHPLTHADLYKAYGKSAGGGILMYGPPGCGKTHLARATAGEINAGFLS